MSQKDQSNRLTSQHKDSQGVIGIFGKEATLHDISVSDISLKIVEFLQDKYSSLTFRHRTSVTKENKAWLGVHLGRGISGFIVPPHYELYGTETYIDDKGNKIISPNNCLWLTNLDTFKRHQDLPLTKQYNGNEEDYPHYDNFDGININKTENIPHDYNGFMGVPITFLHKFNPNQFEVIRFRKGNDEKDLSVNGKCPYFRILIKRKDTTNFAQ